MSWAAPDLSGRVAVVTGASRGVGKGIATVLGECGATVYVTGRSRRGSAREGRTIDDAAEAVTERGGRGIAVAVDHTDAEGTSNLFGDVAAAEGRLDLVVVNAWGGYENYDYLTFGAPLWEQPLDRIDRMLDAGLRAHLITARAAAPYLIDRGEGVIVFTGGWDDDESYLESVPYDVVKNATSRLVTVVARELRPHGVAAVGVYPGFTRTEAVVDGFAAGGMEPPDNTHSPEFVGRAVAHVAAEPDVMSLSGTGAQAATYAERYDFADVDGKLPPRFVMPPESRI